MEIKVTYSFTGTISSKSMATHCQCFHQQIEKAALIGERLMRIIRKHDAKLTITLQKHV